MDLPPHHDPVGLHARAIGEPAPVLGDAPGLVLGEDAEVERAVGAAGATAVAGREDRAGPGQQQLVEELAHSASLRASDSAVSSSSSRPSRGHPASGEASPRAPGRSRDLRARRPPAGRRRRSRARPGSARSPSGAPARPAPPGPARAPAPRAARSRAALGAPTACARAPGAPCTAGAPRARPAPPRRGRVPRGAAPPPRGPAPADPPRPSPPARRSRGWRPA